MKILIGASLGCLRSLLLTHINLCILQAARQPPAYFRPCLLQNALAHEHRQVPDRFQHADDLVGRRGDQLPDGQKPSRPDHPIIGTGQDK